MLPAPIDGTQEYLKAIHDRLGDVLDRLPPKAPESADGTVELREPAQTAQEPETPPVEVAEPKRSASRAGSGATRRSAPRKSKT